jgi:hypothetical protein
MLKGRYVMTATEPFVCPQPSHAHIYQWKKKRRRKLMHSAHILICKRGYPIKSLDCMVAVVAMERLLISLPPPSSPPYRYGSKEPCTIRNEDSVPVLGALFTYIHIMHMYINTM